jgi:hypothetical protein
MPEPTDLAGAIALPTDPRFSECDETTDDRPLRQGDIFGWLDGPPDPLRLFGLIVTADCDIVHSKHHGRLSYVPLLALTDYLRLFLLPERIDRGRRPMSEELSKALLAEALTGQIRAYQASNLPDFPEPMSKEAALRWAGTRGAAEIADDLGIHELRARCEFTDLVADYIFVDDALKNELFSDQIEALVRLRMRKGATREKAVAKVWSEVHEAIRDLPGDAFFVGSVTAVHNSGYVACLRLIRELRDGDVAIRQVDLRGKPPAVAKRLARLRSPYVFRLTRQLADVFGSIGLPTEYEGHRQRLVQQLATGSAAASSISSDKKSS